MRKKIRRAQAHGAVVDSEQEIGLGAEATIRQGVGAAKAVELGPNAIYTFLLRFGQLSRLSAVVNGTFHAVLTPHAGN